jgi:hypothetical protein
MEGWRGYARWRTYVDILGQKLVGDAVLIDNIVVHAGACGRSAEKEAEQSDIPQILAFVPISTAFECDPLCREYVGTWSVEKWM